MVQSNTRVIAFLLTAGTVCLIIPVGVIASVHMRKFSEESALQKLSAIIMSQERLREKIHHLQLKVSEAGSSVATLKDRISNLDLKFVDVFSKANHSLNDIESSAHRVEMTIHRLLTELSSHSSEEFKSLKKELEIRKNHFLVKWHGEKGVKTSKRMVTELEAIDFFNQVGEYAKKLLMFDGSQWRVIREYGGANWLALLHDDGEFQGGEEQSPKT